MNELNRTSPIPDAAAVAARLMAEFAMRTGLCPGAQEQRRYLWTDAFAVCNFLELFQRTSDQQYRRCAEKLIDQVHSVLGQYRNDDARHRWISGLDDEGRPFEGRISMRQGVTRRHALKTAALATTALRLRRTSFLKRYVEEGGQASTGSS